MWIFDGWLHALMSSCRAIDWLLANPQAALGEAADGDEVSARTWRIKKLFLI
jgi:hypothetical protein